MSVYESAFSSMEIDANIAGVYKIYCTANEQCYIGSSAYLRKRLGAHLTLLRRKAHHSTFLQNSFNKYGESEFIVSILEICEPVRDVLLAKEQYWLDTLSPTFNTSKIAGSGHNQGRIHSEETRLKISESKKGTYWTEERKAAWSERWKGVSKGKRSEETKKKLSEIAKGRKLSEETKAKIGASLKGRVFSEEHRAKMGAAAYGRMARAIQKFDRDTGELLGTYRTVTEAGTAHNTYRSNIKKATRGQGALGIYIWRYLDES